MSFWILRQPKLALTDYQVAVGRRPQPASLAARRKRIAIDGVAHADRTLQIKPFGKSGGEEFADMHDQENRQRESVGQAAQKLDARTWSAGGNANGDGTQTTGILQRLGLLRAIGVGARRLPYAAQPGPWMCDDPDARNEFDRGDEILVPRSAWVACAPCVGAGVCPMRPSRARGWVMTLMREMSLTLATSFWFHASSSSLPVGLSSASKAPAASAS